MALRAQIVPRKYPPHRYTTTTSLNRWDKTGWIHAFMFFTSNSDPTIWMSQQKSRLIRRGQRFSNLLLSNFGEPVRIVASVSCSYLTGAAPGVVFCCWSPSASGFDVLCVQRWCSVYLGCKQFTVAFLSSLTSLPILLWHQQGIFVHTTAAHWIFSLFRTILCKT